MLAPVEYKAIHTAAEPVHAGMRSENRIRLRPRTAYLRQPRGNFEQGQVATHRATAEVPLYSQVRLHLLAQSAYVQQRCAFAAEPAPAIDPKNTMAATQ